MLKDEEIPTIITALKGMYEILDSMICNINAMKNKSALSGNGDFCLFAETSSIRIEKSDKMNGAWCFAVKFHDNFEYGLDGFKDKKNAFLGMAEAVERVIKYRF